MVEESAERGTNLSPGEMRVGEILVVLTTVPDEATGERIGRTLVGESLAACVNMVPGLRSFYVWEGTLHDDRELLLVAKIRADRFDAYEARMRELHPYSVPEIVAIPPARVHRPYLEWCLRQGAPRNAR
jgi:periplasmic divalent cation tolerance protein